jgi:hypothetical protein
MIMIMQKAGEDQDRGHGLRDPQVQMRSQGTVFLLTSLPGLVVTDSEACHV